MSHYSVAQRPVKLSEFGVEAALAIIEEFKGKDNVLPVFVYCGMSGISAATALMLAIHRLDPFLPYVMAYVRKENEESHGSKVECEFVNTREFPNTKQLRAVFVDDFVASGNTLRYSIRTARSKFLGDGSGLLEWDDDSLVLNSTKREIYADSIVMRAKHKSEYRVFEEDTSL